MRTAAKSSAGRRRQSVRSRGTSGRIGSPVVKQRPACAVTVPLPTPRAGHLVSGLASATGYPFLGTTQPEPG